MATPFLPGEPSEQKPDASSSLLEQTGELNDFGAAQGNTDNDELMKEVDSHDTPNAGAGVEYSGGRLVPFGGGLPLQTFPLRITAGPSNLDEPLQIQGRPPKRPRVDTSGPITVELPKSQHGIKANQALAEQVKTLKSLHQTTLDGHSRTLAEYQYDMETFRRTIQERIDQTEAAAHKDRKRADVLQDLIKNNEEARARAASEAAERENKMTQALMDMKVRVVGAMEVFYS